MGVPVVSDKKPEKFETQWFVAAVYFFVPGTFGDCLIIPVTFPAKDMEQAKELALNFGKMIFHTSASGAYQLPNGSPVVLWKISISELPEQFAAQLDEEHFGIAPKARTNEKKEGTENNVVPLFPEAEKPTDEPPKKDPPKS